MFLTLLVIIVVAVMAVLIYRRRHALTVLDRAPELDAHQPTDKEIEQAFRETEAPERRPYRGGEFGVDMSGRKFIADQNGALRRVEVVEISPESGETIAMVRKLNKAERKLRKRQKHELRSSVEFSIERTLSKIRAGLISSGADPSAVARINVNVDDWHTLGRLILQAASTKRHLALVANK